MKTIWKYEVPITDRFVLAMPKGAEALSVQGQFSAAQMWAAVDVDARETTRRFAVVGTGHEMPEGEVAFVGTFQVAGGVLVFHLFELLPDGARE